MNALLLATLLFGQVEEKFVPRVSKDVYLQAVRDLAKAADLISDDPQTAVDRVTNILTNTRIKFFECRLKIEVQPSIPQYEDFFPYQVRGRARLNLGKKATLDASVGVLGTAIEDLKASADKKVPGSADLLKEAETLLAQKKSEIVRRDAEKDNPFTKFKPKYDDYLNNDRYRTALTYVTNSPEGQKLTEEQREAQKVEVEQKCADFRDSRIGKFKGKLNDTSVSALSQMDDRDFNREFALLIPSDSELTDKAIENPTLDWIRRHMKTLKSIKAGQGKIEETIAAATEALKLDAPDTQDENSYFKAMSFLASELCSKAITAYTDKAENASKSDRAKLQEGANQVMAQWKNFIETAGEPVLKRHPDVATCTERLADFSRKFPIELTTELAAFDIDKCFLGDPAPELKTVEDGLLNLMAGLGGRGKVAIESKQELYTKLITAGTLRRFIEGMPEDQVLRDWSDYRAGLASANLPSSPDRYGPKVKRIFDKLLKKT